MTHVEWIEDRAMGPEAERIAEVLDGLTIAQRARVLADYICHEYTGELLMRLSGRWLQETAAYIADEQGVSMEEAAERYAWKLHRIVGDEDMFGETFSETYSKGNKE